MRSTASAITQTLLDGRHGDSGGLFNVVPQWASGTVCVCVFEREREIWLRAQISLMLFKGFWLVLGTKVPLGSLEVKRQAEFRHWQTKRKRRRRRRGGEKTVRDR